METPGSRKPIWKDPIFWFVIALGVGYGAVYNILPVTFPIFRREFGASLEQMGHSQSLFFIASLFFSLIAGPTIAILGLKRAALVALTVAASALLVIGSAHHFGIILIIAPLYGFSIIALVVVSNSLVSRHFGEMRQSVFFVTGLSDAGGTMIGPALLGLWFAHSSKWNVSWRWGYVIAAMDMAFLFIWALFMRTGNLLGGTRRTSSEMPIAAVIKNVLSNSAFYVAALLEFCHGVGQAAMIAFIGQVYVSKLHIDAAQAAYFISLNAAGILCGRTALSWITARWKIPELVVMSLCAAGQMLAFLAAILSPGYLLGAAMFTLAGMFVSAIGPSLNSYLGGKFSVEASTAFSLFAGLGNVGAAVGPLLVGTLATYIGIETGILFAPVFTGLLSAIALLRYRRERQQLCSSILVAP